MNKHTTEYDYLIVGSGLFGAVFAHEMTCRGKRCLIVERRPHIGGNVYCEQIEGINVHKYGAHIFHTNDHEVWQYVNQFVSFNRYTNSPVARYKNELYNLPFNMNTFHALWGVATPAEAQAIIEQQRGQYANIEPANLEEQALKLVGKDIYEKLIKEYTEKQWGRSCKELPAFIIKRLPLRFVYDNNYFNDQYQGIPIGGYNPLIDQLVKGSDIMLNTDFFENRAQLSQLAQKIVFTGALDAWFDYALGKLSFRSLKFEHELLNEPNYQGNAVVNYTSAEVAFTRIIEHKHFEFGTQPKTVITREYPHDWTPQKEAYYPINDTENEQLASEYRKMSEQEENVIFGGRLAEYKYYNMDQVIRRALDAAKQELQRI